MMYLLIRDRLPQDGSMELDTKSFFSAVLIAVCAFAISNLSFVTKNTPFSGQYAMEIANIRTMIDLAGISMLYAHLLQCSEAKTKRELEAVQNVLQSLYQQYKQWRESINLINYKYHDLKHQIEFLRNEPDAAKRDDFLNQMEDEIKNYELQNKTGNSVLDTVLTGKSLYCNKHGITLTTVVDGTLLDFLNAMDICSIFGNALDNAIESELKIPVKEKRLIHVTVTKQKSFLLIRFENYYEGDLKYQGKGNLVTTKKEKGFHGYGIKSIKYTVNKYDGAVNIKAENHWFDMEILIPLPLSS
jgi:sensor histidine kinase regulating citrate/malate metabolism